MVSRREATPWHNPVDSLSENLLLFLSSQYETLVEPCSSPFVRDAYEREGVAGLCALFDDAELVVCSSEDPEETMQAAEAVLSKLPALGQADGRLPRFVDTQHEARRAIVFPLAVENAIAVNFLLQVCLAAPSPARSPETPPPGDVLELVAPRFGRFALNLRAKKAHRTALLCSPRRASPPREPAATRDI